MKRLRDPNWVLIFLFLGILAAVPVIQTIEEASGDEGVIAFEVFSSWPTAENLRAFEHKLEAPSWLGQLSRPWLQFVNFTWLKEGGQKVVIGSQGWYFFKPGLAYMLSRNAPAKQPNATNDPVAAIVDFRDQLAARGVQLMVMPVPNKDSVYPDRLTSRARAMRGVMSPRTRKVLAGLRDAGVEVVDLFQEFKAARLRADANTETPLYLAQDTHWSPVGVKIAARSVAHRLIELGWVEPGRVDYREQPAPVNRMGDLLRMLESPPIERALHSETVPTVQVVRSENGQLYSDEPGAQILVLGDSFMRVYQTDAPNSAGFIAHLAEDLKQPMMSLVNDGGGATLAREELCARPVFLKNKKVVVWEFVERDIGLGIKGWRRTPLPKSRESKESQ